ncbi:hypothetical protein [Rummeliibacillus stabekisii]|uniref:hypothetical protein n=1 Tax=Rummeliibacillus stabekisii TaxID=241244 RepID=UPI003D812D31
MIERRARTMKNMNNISNIHLLAFSIPFFTPPGTIQIVKIINKPCAMTTSHGFWVRVMKRWL